MPEKYGPKTGLLAQDPLSHTKLSRLYATEYSVDSEIRKQFYQNFALALKNYNASGNNAIIQQAKAMNTDQDELSSIAAFIESKINIMGGIEKFCAVYKPECIIYKFLDNRQSSLIYRPKVTLAGVAIPTLKIKRNSVSAKNVQL